MSDVKKLITLAKTSSCSQTLDKLSSYNNLYVRRAAARNINTSSKTLEKLAFDTVLNVSYMAVQNPNCNISRSFEENQLCMCVTCDKDERYVECSGCFN